MAWDIRGAHSHDIVTVLISRRLEAVFALTIWSFGRVFELQIPEKYISLVG